MTGKNLIFFKFNFYLDGGRLKMHLQIVSWLDFNTFICCIYEIHFFLIKGKLEADFLLLTEEDALKDPAGRGHEGPHPLEIPNRPDDSYLWFLSPLKTLRYDLWKNHKCLILKIFILVIIVVFILIFFFQLPSAFLQRILKINN